MGEHRCAWNAGALGKEEADDESIPWRVGCDRERDRLWYHWRRYLVRARHRRQSRAVGLRPCCRTVNQTCKGTTCPTGERVFPRSAGPTGIPRSTERCWRSDTTWAGLVQGATVPSLGRGNLQGDSPPRHGDGGRSAGRQDPVSAVGGGEAEIHEGASLRPERSSSVPGRAAFRPGRPAI